MLRFILAFSLHLGWKRWRNLMDIRIVDRRHSSLGELAQGVIWVSCEALPA
jgi:hypothetical protein